MKKSTIISIILIIAAGLIGYGFGVERQVQKTVDVPSENGEPIAEKKEPIKIGALFPLTGDIASYGLEAQKALDMTVEEINTEGGINGREVTIVYEDERCDQQAAVTGAQKLVNIDKVKVILGAACSGPTLAVAPITEVAKVILLSPWSTSPDITTAGDYVFRLSPSDILSAKKSAELVYKTLGYKNGAIIIENTAAGVAAQNSLTESFEKLGGKIVVKENYNTGDTDMRTQILKVKNSEAEFVFLGPQIPASGALLAKQIKENGLDLYLIGNEMYGDQDLIKGAGGAAEGIVYYSPDSPEDNPKTQKFYTDFKNKYGVEIVITRYTPNIYDAVQIIADGLRKYDEDTDQIKNYLYSIKDYQGVSGQFSFDKNGDVDKDYTLMVVKNGQSVQYEK